MRLETMFKFIAFCSLFVLIDVVQTNHEHRFPLFDALIRTLRTQTLMLDERLNDMKNDVVNFSQRINWTDKARTKRSVDSSLRPQIKLLKQTTPTFSLTTPSVVADLVYVKNSRNLFLIGAGKSNLDGSTTMTNDVLCPIWMWNETVEQFKPFATISTPGAVGVEGFVIDDRVYFIFAINPKPDLLDYVKRDSNLYRITKRGQIALVQSFVTTGATVWKSFQFDGNVYLIQAGLVKWRRMEKFHQDYAQVMMPKGSSEVYVYKWTGIAFLRTHIVAAKHCIDVDVASVAGRTFLAVVNQTFDEFYVESTVLIYEFAKTTDDDYGEIRLLQRISGWAVSDVHFVREENVLFLGIAYEFSVQNGMRKFAVNSAIHRFNGMFFVRHQTLPTSCALKWSTLRGKDGQIALHLQTTREEFVFQLIDDVWKSLPLHFIDLTSSGPGNQRIPIASVDYLGKDLTVVGRVGKIQFVRLEFQPIGPENTFTLGVKRRCEQLTQRIDELRRSRQEFEVSNKRLASRTLQQNIVGLKHFDLVEIRNLHLRNVTVRRSQLYRRMLLDRLKIVSRLIDDLPQNLDKFLKKNAVQIIPQNVTVKNVWIDSVLAKRIHFRLVNDKNFCHFLSKVVDLAPTSSSSSTNKFNLLHFDNIEYRNEVVVRGTVNTVSIPGNLAFINRENRFTARKNFVHGFFVKGNLNVKGTVNDIRPERILLATGQQTIRSDTVVHGDVHIVNVDLVRNVKIGGISWAQLMNDTVKMDSPLVMSGRKSFVGDLIVRGDFKPSGLVSGVDVQKLLSSAIPLDVTHRFSAPVSFRDVVFRKGMMLKGNLNDVKIPSQLILTEHSTWDANLEMKESLHVQRLVVRGLINGLRIDRDHVMTKSDNQTVTGKKLFHDIHVDKELIFSGILNGNDITRIVNNIKSEQVPAETRYKSLTVKNLNVDGKLPEDLAKLLYETVKVDDEYEFPGTVNFVKIAHFEDVVNLPPVIFRNLVSLEKKKSKILLETRVFHEDVVFEDNVFVNGLINGLSLVQLANNVLTKDSNQTIHKEKIFKNNIKLLGPSLFNKDVNEIRLEKAVNINREINIRGKLLFKRPTLVHEIRVDSTFVRNKINSIVANEWFEDTLLIDSDQNVTGSKKFIDTVNVGIGSQLRDVNVVGEFLVNGINFESFIQDVVFVDETNILTGIKTFVSHSNIQHLQTHVIDRVNVVDLFSNALRVNDERCLRVQSNISIRELRTTFINDIDVINLFNNFVHVDDAVLPAKLHFANVVTSDVRVVGKVNGAKFSEDVITKSDLDRSVTFMAPKTFSNLVNVERVAINGLINGVNVVQLDKTAVKQGEKQNFSGIWHIDRIHLKKSLNFNGLLNGKTNWTKFIDDAWFVDDNVTLTDVVTFETMTYEPVKKVDLVIGGKIDNVNLTWIYNNMMNKETDQIIEGPIIVKNQIVFDTLNVKADVKMSQKSFVNGLKLATLSSKILKKHEDQRVTAKKFFVDQVFIDNSITVQGKINNVDLEDVARIKGNQKFFDVKRFFKIIVNRLDVGGLLNQVNIQTWNETAFFLDSATELTLSHDEFGSLVFEDDVRFMKTIDGINLNDVITVKESQLISGTKIFVSEIVTPRWTGAIQLTGRVNDISIPFQQIIEYLLLNPLPYPCKPHYVHYMNGCFRVISIGNICENGDEKVVPSQSDLHLLRYLNLPFEDAHKWIICYQQARLQIKEETILKGNFSFGETVVQLDNGRALTTPLQNQVETFLEQFEIIESSLISESLSLKFKQQDTCIALQNIQCALRHAHRSLGPFNLIQTIHVDPLAVAVLNPSNTFGVFTFLVVDKFMVDIYQWQNTEFIKTDSKRLTLDKPIKRIPLEIVEQATGIVLISFPNPITNCSQNSIDTIELRQLMMRYQSEDFAHIANIKQTLVKLDRCVSFASLKIASFKEQIFLLIGHQNTLVIRKWTDDVDEFRNFLALNVSGSIYRVEFIHPLGLIAIASRQDGASNISIYHLNVLDKSLSLLFTFLDEAHVRQISGVAPIVFDFLVATKQEVKLVKHDAASNRFSITQKVKMECFRRMFSIVAEDFVWFVMTSCRCSSQIYAFQNFLRLVHETENLISIQPKVFVHNEHVVMLTPSTYGCGYPTSISILRAMKRGPKIGDECVLECAKK